MSDNALDDTKVRILEAAGRTFAERGFREATVRDICQSAGSNVASINYHFGDKERLYIESVKLAHREMLQHMPLPQWPAGVPAAAKLHGFIYTFLCRVLNRDDNWQRRLMLREIAQPSAACEELAREYIRPQFAVLLGILNELLPPETPDVVRHRTAFSIVGQCLHYLIAGPIVRWLVPPDEVEQNVPEQLAAHIWRFSLAGIAGVSPSAAAAEVPPLPHAMQSATTTNGAAS